MRLFGCRHYRLSEIWSRDNGTFARYRASISAPAGIFVLRGAARQRAV